MARTITGLALVATLLTSSLAAADESAPLVLASGEQRVALVELYTSEGCSSCPPADRWLSRLKKNPQLWREFTPIAFHVDYWDYIGWTDPFASPRHGERQRRYAREGGVRAVYTPGVFRDGMEWRDWRAGNAPIPGDETAGDLRLQVDGSKVDVEFAASELSSDGLTVHVAVLGMNLQSKVNAGENDGRLLRHDFVTLGMTTENLVPDKDGYRASLSLPEEKVATPERAIVAWVSRQGRLAPVQSVGGFLPMQDIEG